MNPDTRPRIKFDENGTCNACLWAEEKKGIDWDKQKERLVEYLERARKESESDWDLIVPVSGGKDGSYVAGKVKEMGYNPLCVSFSPPLQNEIGRKNLDNFRNSGFDLIEIRPNPEKYRALCKKLFIERAMSKFPFVIGIGTAVSRLAKNYGIYTMIYGEEGETEYGGFDGYKYATVMDWLYYTRFYHEDIVINDSWWKLLDKDDYEMVPNSGKPQLKSLWWSKFEKWDDKLHADYAIKNCGLMTQEQVGTFTNYAQLDDYLQDLHMYECFIKFGFGRATADANLALKAGRITREQGLEIIKAQDGLFPLEHLDKYLEYFGMTSQEFWAVIEKHANKDILVNSNDLGRPYVLKV